MRRLLPLVLLAACSPAPLPPERAREREIESLVRTLADSPAAEDAIIACGERAIPALAHAVRRDPRPVVRSRASRALGRIHRATGARLALDAFVEAVEGASGGEVLRALLGNACYFPDPEGQVLRHLGLALAGMREATPEMVRSAAALSEFEALAAMEQFLANTAGGSDPARDLAVAYLGRAARKGRTDAIDFLTRLADPGVARAVDEQLAVVAGNLHVKNWRGWYLSVATKTRWQWLVEAAGYALGEPFRVADRGHVTRLIEKVGEREAEPDFALLEPLLGRTFGYAPLMDVFDPDAPREAIEEANRRATAGLKSWWKENAPYAWYDAAQGRWEINEEARSSNRPVDPKTGEILPPEPPK